MSDFIHFIEELLHDRFSDIDIGMIGRIESFDSKTMRADVVPLLKKKGGGGEVEYSILKEVPVNFLLSGDYFIRPEYKMGDLVHISFSTHDIEEALKDRIPLASEKIFTSENAFITGGIAKTGWDAPGVFSEKGLLIGHKDGSAFSQYTADELVHKFNNSIISLKDDEITLSDGNGNVIKTDTEGVDINGGALKVGT